jgi:transporter family protein
MVLLGGFIFSLFLGTLQNAAFLAVIWFAAAGVMGPGIGNICSTIGIVRMGVNRSIAISSSSPIWASLFAIIVLGERPTFWVLIGTIGIVTGVILLAIREDESHSFSSWFRSALIFPLITSLAYALTPNFAKIGFAHQQTPFVAMVIAFAAGNVLILTGRSFSEIGGKIRATRSSWLWFCMAGTFNFLSTFLLWQALIRGNITTIVPLSRLSPLWILILSYLFFKKLERITFRLVLATSFVVAGGVFITAFIP